MTAGADTRRSPAEEALRQRQTLLAAQKEAFQAAMNGSPLEMSLGILVRTVVDEGGGNLRCGIFLSNDEGNELRHLVGMPDQYARDVDGLAISPESLSCGVAVATGKPDITADVLADPRWKPWLWLARANDYRACWSYPIETASGVLVGSLAMYGREPRVPTVHDTELATALTQTAAIIISHWRSDDALRKSEERLLQFSEASRDILWIRDAASMQWTYLTQAFEPIFGLSREEAMRGDTFQRWQDLVVPQDRQVAVDNVERVRRGEHVTFDYRIRRPNDGAIRWLRATNFPIRDETGKVVMIGGITHDTTELRASDLRLQSLIHGIPQLVWRAEHSGAWTWTNPQWTAFTGLSPEESLGRGFMAAVHPDDRERVRRLWQEAATSGRFDCEGRLLQAATGEYRWFQARAEAVRDERGEIVEWLGTSTDIHELRVLQERQQVLVGELQHRTRNLMGVVRAIADKTARGTSDFTEFRARFRDRIQALARVQNLLSALGDDDRVTFDQLIHSELAGLDGGVTAPTLSGPTDVRLRSSTVQPLAMALHELGTNAVKYGALGQPDARLTIAWSVDPAGPSGQPWLHIDWRESGVSMRPNRDPSQGGGQGRDLIERALPYQFGATTTYELEGDGVHCTIAIPISKTVGT